MLLGLSWNEWGVLGTWATAAIAAVAIGFSVEAWIVSKRTLKHSIVESLYKEYGTTEMAESVLNLQTTFRESTQNKDRVDLTEEDQRKFLNDYKEQYKSDPKKTLHWHRRRVSVFYQRMAFLCEKDRYLTRLCKSMWGMDDLDIVRKIIIPIETVALPELLGGKVCKNESDYVYSMEILLEFANRRIRKERVLAKRRQGNFKSGG